MIVIEIALLAIVGAAIFIFNAAVMRRSQIDQGRARIEEILRQRLEKAAAILQEPASKPPETVADRLALDALLEKKVNAMPASRQPEELAAYRGLASKLRQELEGYRPMCAAYNRIAAAPPFRWLPKFSKREEF